MGKNGNPLARLGYVGRVLSGVRFQELGKSLEKAKERSGKNKVWLFCDILACSVLYGAGYHDYVMFGFYDMPHKNRKTYVTRLKNKKLVTCVNDTDVADTFDQKVKFCPRFREYLGRDFLVTETMTREIFGEFMRDKDVVFAKPDVGESGKGIEKLKKESFSSLEAMFLYLKEGNFGVVEEALCQHEALDKLYPGSINSLRVVTLLTGAPGKEVSNCVYVVLKMGSGGKYVDNLENGGMFCPVDLDTEEITGVAHTSDLSNYTVHPDTRVPLIGYHVPFVREAVELCKKAALEEPKMRYLGWDVCITPEGPAIIEGNDYPGYDFWQQPEHTPDKIGLWPYYQTMIPEL